MMSVDNSTNLLASDDDENGPSDADSNEIQPKVRDWTRPRTLYLASGRVNKDSVSIGILSPSPSVNGVRPSLHRAKKRKLQSNDEIDIPAPVRGSCNLQDRSLRLKDRCISRNSLQSSVSTPKGSVELPHSPRSHLGDVLKDSIADRFPSALDDYRKILRSEIKRLQEDHGFFVKCLLQDQRIACSTPPLETFHTFRAIEPAISQAKSNSRVAEPGTQRKSKLKEQSPTRTINLTSFTSAGARTSSKVMFKITKYKPTTPPLPKDYGYYSRLKSHIAMDCGQLKYQYDDEGMQQADILDINEAYVDQVEETTARNHQKELAIKYRGYVLTFIELVGLSLLHIARYLSLHRSSEARDYQSISSALLTTGHAAVLSEGELRCMLLINQALTEELKLEIADVFPPDCRHLTVDLLPSSRLPLQIDLKDPQDFSNLEPQALDTYINLDCLSCYRHECSQHGNLLVADEEESIILRFSGPNYTEIVDSTSGSDLPLCQKTRSVALLEALPTFPFKMIESIETWSESPDLPQPCSEECHRNQKIPIRCYLEKTRKWSKGEEDLILMSLAVYGVSDWSNSACILSAVIDRKCIEVYKQAQNYKQPVVSSSLRANQQRAMTHTEMKEKTVTSSHLERFVFQPCFHIGPCVQNECTCVDQGIACEKACFCSSSCRRRFRGCSCRQSSKAKQNVCQTNRCECVDLNRECDPDLCGNCGADELLDPENRRRTSLSPERCKNVSLQRGLHKPLLVGKSELAGNGAYLGIDGAAYDFIGEYTGEIIDEQESQRRGRVYDARGLSYIFTINKESAIDASAFGTKVRFINHSQVRENCAPKVLFVNGSHRIGIWLKVPVKAGQELFMNYGEQFVKATAGIRDFEGSQAMQPIDRSSPEVARHTGRKSGSEKSGLTLRIQNKAAKSARSRESKDWDRSGTQAKDVSSLASKAEIDSPLSDPSPDEESTEDEDIRSPGLRRRH